jgi:hypothetical protein
MNEARQNQEGWCRAKRRPANLPDSWDDRSRCIQDTWKVKRKTQYHIGGRGKKHTIVFDRKIKEWILQEYFEKHNIPYKIESVNESYMRKFPIRKKIIVAQVPKYVIKYIWQGRKLIAAQQHQVGYKDIVEWKTVGYTYKPVNYVIGYKVTWWSDKDIGIEYIMKGQKVE